jgi:PIN domain nuclease of toxin-antitoxin system
MPYLLDTSVFLSAVIAPEHLGRRARQLLSEQSEVFFLSAASSWEISIKYSLGKLHLPELPARWVPAAMRRLGVRPLDIVHRHALSVGDLPAHHQDPFDRVLIAQAKAEELVVLTTDRVFQKYGVRVLHCGS